MDCGCGLLSRCEVHGHMVSEIHNYYWGGLPQNRAVIYAQQDGYGERGFIPSQGMDWSGIRDSSPDAIERMFLVVQGIKAGES